MLRPIRSLSVVNMKIKCEIIYASDHLRSICLIVQIFGSSSLRQLDHERNNMFFITTPPKSGHILEKTQRWVPISFLSTDSRE